MLVNNDQNIRYSFPSRTYNFTMISAIFYSYNNKTCSSPGSLPPSHTHIGSKLTLLNTKPVIIKKVITDHTYCIHDTEYRYIPSKHSFNSVLL